MFAVAASHAFVVVGTTFPADAPRFLVVARYVRGHMHIACENEHSVGTISTILAVSVAHTASGWTAVARLALSP